MHAKKPWSVSVVAILAAGVLSPAGVIRAAAASSNSDAFPILENSITIRGDAASISGSETAFQARARRPSDGGAGIENLYIYKPVSDTTEVEIQGHALAGLEDYLGSVEVRKTDIGSFELGFKSFRTFYDGIGGFFPVNGYWTPLVPQDLHVDRSDFWVEGQLTMPNSPAVTLRYERQTRDGSKPSTHWGESGLTGISGSTGRRKIIANKYDLDEVQQRLEARVDLKLGTTSVSASAAGHWTDNNNLRSRTDYLGESTQVNNVQNDAISTEGFTALITTETPLSDKVTLNTGWKYDHVDADMGGYRTDDPNAAHPHNFYNLVGVSQIETYTANGSLTYRPSAIWMLQGTVRVENKKVKSNSNFDTIHGTVTEKEYAHSEVNDKVVTPQLDIRYTGIPKVLVYAMARDRMNRGDRTSAGPETTVVPDASDYSPEDVDQDQSQYKLGANWNQSAAFTARAEVFRKKHENKFTGKDAILGDKFVGGLTYTGLKLTAIVTPMPEVKLTSRYVSQQGSIQLTTDRTDKFDSGRMKSYLIGETLDWNPTQQFYLQIGGNLGYDVVITAYPRAQTPANRAPQANGNNNYALQTITSGFVLDRNTDVQLQYTKQYGHNYQPELALGTTPYGSGYSDTTYNVTIKRRMSDDWFATLKVGHIESNSEATGGNSDFKGPLGYLAIEHAL